MSYFWWVVLALLVLTALLALLGLLAWLWSGDPRHRDFARASGRWSVVVMLAAAIVAIFTDLIGVLFGGD